MGTDLKDRIVDNIKGKDEGDVIEQCTGIVLNLKNDVVEHHKSIFRNLNLGFQTSEFSEKGANFIDKLNKKLEENPNSLECALLKNPQVQTLLSSVVDTQEGFLTKERNRYIIKEKNRELDVGDSDFESYEGFNIGRLSQENFENYLLGDKRIRITKKHIRNHINPETGEVYHNYPISKNAFRVDLKNGYDTSGFIQYYSNAPAYEIVKDYPRIICGLIEDEFNYLVGEYMKNGGDKFDTELINNLEGLINKIESSLLSYERDDEDEEGKDNIRKGRRDLFKILLEKIINNYTDLVYKDGKISLETGDIQIDLQLKSYLYVYCKIFFPELLTGNGKKGYNNELTEVLKVILLDYNPELEAQIKNKELLEQKRKQEQELKERERKRRQEAEKRNRERNNHLDRDSGKKSSFQDQNSDKAKDNNSGVNLVKKSKVDLSDYKSFRGNNLDSLSKNTKVKDRALNLAWNDFIESNDGIKDIITYADMLKLYNVETNKIDEDARKSFLETDIMKGRTDEEINQIYETLQSFSNNYNEAIKSISARIKKGREKMDDKVKMYALGAVIDNVKDIFNSIVSKWQGDSKFEGFSFDSHEPVKRQGNNIIISGKFNGANIKIRYDLVSGGLFMNSFVQHLSQSKVTIGNNTDADYKIGQLESFDTILEEHYHSPRLPDNKAISGSNGDRKFSNQNNVGIYGGEKENDNNQEISSNQSKDTAYQSESPTTETYNTRISKDKIISLRKRFYDMLNANVDLIGDVIVNHTKKQSTNNSVIIKFMKTFNIVLDENNIKNIDVSNESNMFDFIQIIENSDSLSLESFQTFMGKVMEYAGLSRGNNNLQGSQRNKKSDLILDENNDNKYASLLRESSRDFSNNLVSLKGKLNFDSNSQIGFIKMISENITNDVTKPNWKLDISKMNEFIYHLGNGTKTVV